MDPISFHYSLNLMGSDKLASGAQVIDPQAVEAFQQRLHDQPVPASGHSNTLPPLDPANGSLGDKILHGLQNVKSGYDSQVGAVQNSLKGGDPLSVNEMMQLQLDLSKLSLQGELINKTVSKSTQNLDTLLKSQ